MRRLSPVPALALLYVLSPSTGLAGPPEPDPPDTPNTPDTPGTTFQVQGPGTQSQQSPPAPPPAAGPSIQVNPQIQVQVQPTIDARAEPRADAAADAKAEANADAKPTAEAKADVDVASETKSEPVAGAAEASSATGHEAEGTRARAPAPGVPAQRRIRVVMRSSSPHHHDVGAHRQRGRGLLTAGLVGFGAGYATAAINGGWLYDQCEDANCRRVARELFVPVAGPFLAMQHVEQRDTQIKLGVMGGAQSLGVLLGLVGASVAIHDARAQRRLDADGVRVAEHVHVAPHAGVDGTGLTLRARF